MLVCDEVLYSLTGKVNLLGIYTTDIGIPRESHLAPQLAFFFSLEGSIDEQPQAPMMLEVVLPGGGGATLEVPRQPPLNSPQSGRTKWYLRIPVLAQQAVLRSGRIVGKVKCGADEMSVYGPWITLSDIPSPAPSAS
jgi:hypothetical protein